MGGLGFTDPVVTSSSEYEASIKVTNPLVRRIFEQEHQPPDVWIFMLEVFGRDKSAFFDVPVCHPNADSNAVCGKSNGDWTGNVHSPSFHDQVEWRISVPQQTCGAHRK